MKYSIYHFLSSLLFIQTLCFFYPQLQAQPPGKSVVFDGTNYISVPDNSSLDQDSSITIEAWINPCQVTNSMQIVTKLWCDGGNDGYHFNIKNGKLQWHWDPDGSCGNTVHCYESDSAIIQVNTWQHVALVYTLSGITFYHNGNPISGSLIGGNYGTPIYNNNQPLRIGAYRRLNGTFAAFFQGRIDEFRVWDSSLSPMDIQARMNDTLTGNEPSLVAYYDMENNGIGAGITVTNGATSTGTTNNGTTVGTGTTPFFLDNSISFDSLDLGPDSISASVGITLSADSSGAQYLWQDGSTDTTLTTSTTGWYWVDAIIGGCSVRDSVHFTLLPLDIDGSLADPDAPFQKPDKTLVSHSVMVYPNPFTNHFTIHTGAAFNRIRLFDMRGGLIQEEHSEKSDYQIEMKVPHLPSGMYILEIRFLLGNTIRKKILKA